MGRYSTGAVTTKEVTRLELSYLLRQGYIRRDGFSLGTLTWTNGNRMSLSTHIGQDDEDYIRLTYSFKAGGDGQAIQKDYKIYITYLPSNLGRGSVPYFVCPTTGRRARVLYMCYGSPIFKCRTAYQNRIYYASQSASKFDYHNQRYWTLDKALVGCRARKKKNHYRGKPTRLADRIKDMEEERQYHDLKRFLVLPKGIGEYFLSAEGLHDFLEK